MTADRVPRQSRFWQFSLRQMFVLTGLLTVLFALLVQQSRRTPYQEAVERKMLRKNALERMLLRAAETGDAALAARAIGEGAGGSRTALDRAIEKGHVPVVRLLLDAGAFTGCRAAVISGDASMLELLLSHSAAEEYDCTEGVVWTLRCDHPPDIEEGVVRVLLKHGANLDAAMDTLCPGCNPRLAEKMLHYGARLTPFVAAELNRLEELKRMVEDDPSVLHETFEYECRISGQITLLGIALRRGHYEMASFLLDRGSPIHASKLDNQTLLHAAAIGGDADFIRLLADGGFDPNEAGPETPLCLAIGGGHVEAVEALIEIGADVNAGEWGTPLKQAVIGDQREIVQMLLAAGADPLLASNAGSSERTSAWDAARRKATETGNREFLQWMEQAIETRKAAGTD